MIRKKEIRRDRIGRYRVTKFLVCQTQEQRGKLIYRSKDSVTHIFQYRSKTSRREVTAKNIYDTLFVPN